jgi:hypothetical protein
MKKFLALVVILASLGLGLPCSRATDQAQQITVSLPAENVRQALNSVMPLPLELDRQEMEGEVQIQSVDRLQTQDNVLSLAGVLQGQNLFITTNLGGQPFRLKVGQVTLPVSCDLLLRFDQAAQTLFVTPRFAPPPSSQINDPNAALNPLLAQFGNREYPIALNRLRSPDGSIGGQTIPANMTPVDIEGREGALILTLQPQSRK